MSARVCAVCWWLSLVGYGAIALAATTLIALTLVDLARHLP